MGGSDNEKTRGNSCTFIRHLPSLSETEIQEMRKLNPKNGGRPAGRTTGRTVSCGESLSRRLPRKHITIEVLNKETYAHAQKIKRSSSYWQR